MSAATRTVYNLEKYSRATPHEKQGGKGFELEWHHHTTPVLRLLLEIRQTHAGIVESARMRVVHTRMSSNNGATAHENTVLEDIDFVTVQKQNAELAIQGMMPLKAVYRDGMLGVRYVHRISNALPSTQRRFQVTFLSEENIAEVIAAIKDVCPIKQSGSGVQYSQYETQVNNSSAIDLPPPAPPSAASNLRGDKFMLCSKGPRKPSLQVTTSSRPPVSAPSSRCFISTQEPMGAAALRAESINSTSTLAQQGISTAPHKVATHGFPTSTPEIGALPIKDFPVLRLSQQASCDVDPQPVHSDELLLPTPTVVPVHLSNSDDSLPSSSAAPSSDKDSSATVVQPLDASVLSSEVEGLLPPKLSNQDLESLIAQIIHEDSFAQLLEAIDKLWRLKALLT